MESEFVIGNILKSRITGRFYKLRGFYNGDKTLPRLTGLHWKKQTAQSIFHIENFIKVGHDGI